VEPLAHQLRALRAGAGRTVASVATEAGLSVPYIANLENGRGNPTITALGRLASALGMRLVITLTPAGGDGPAAAGAHAQTPASLVRFGRTRRFRRATQAMAGALGADPQDLSLRLVGALSQVAGALGTDLGETDWGRILDALVLVSTHPGGAAEPRP
jgi:transcriptional regulator with XRE-family HTH domain